MIVAFVLLAGCDSMKDEEDSRCQGWRQDYVAELDKILLNPRPTQAQINLATYRANEIAARMRSAKCDDAPVPIPQTLIQ